VGRRDSAATSPICMFSMLLINRASTCCIAEVRRLTSSWYSEHKDFFLASFRKLCLIMLLLAYLLTYFIYCIYLLYLFTYVLYLLALFTYVIYLLYLLNVFTYVLYLLTLFTYVLYLLYLFTLFIYLCT
jgi:hypothetical protein